MNWFALIAAALLAVPAVAQEPRPVAKAHALRIAGGTLRYTAAFERFAVAAPGSRAGASITTISYVRDTADPGRPVVFAFNGGPGSTSIFLNVGLLGPRRVDLPSDPARPIPAAAPLVDNQDSILDVADVVLIDPVGTGFSRLNDQQARRYFYSVQGDAQAVADAIAAWTRRHRRAASPKYIVGESYGAVRAVFVARDMRRVAETANVRGVVLISQSLPIIDTVQRRSNIVGQAVGMPTLAASAWYHGLAGKGRPLPAFVAEAAAFAREEWLPALMAGSALSTEARQRVAAGLARYTGLPATYFLAHDLYLTKEEYRRLALAGRGEVLGLYDTRYTGPGGARDPDEALVDAIAGADVAMWQDALGIDTRRYRPAGAGALKDLGESWTYLEPPFAPTSGETYRQIDYTADLIELMARTPRLRIVIAGGWYDTAASAGADDWLLSRPGIAAGRIDHVRYEGGHMFYTDPGSRSAFAGLLRRLIGGSAR